MVGVRCWESASSGPSLTRIAQETNQNQRNGSQRKVMTRWKEGGALIFSISLSSYLFYSPRRIWVDGWTVDLSLSCPVLLLPVFIYIHTYVHTRLSISPLPRDTEMENRIWRRDGIVGEKNFGRRWFNC
jgi:hypothetical protein